MIIIYKGQNEVFVQATEDLMRILSKSLRKLYGKSQTRVPFHSSGEGWITLKQINVWGIDEDFLHGLASICKGLYPQTEIIPMVNEEPADFRDGEGEEEDSTELIRIFDSKREAGLYALNRLSQDYNTIDVASTERGRYVVRVNKCKDQVIPYIYLRIEGKGEDLLPSTAKYTLESQLVLRHS